MFEYLIPIVLGGFLYYYHNKKTCEDSYQHKRGLINNNKALIIYVGKYNETNYFTSINEVKIKLKNLNDRFTNHKIDENYLYDNKYDYIMNNTFNCKVFIDEHNKTFYTSIDHKYIGGSKLACCTFIANKNSNQKDYFYNSKWYHIFPTLKLLWNINNIPKVNKPLPLYNNDTDIKRYIYEYKFDRTTNVKATIIYNIMKDLYKCLNLNRPLVCYLPIAFNPTTSIYNNIGIMFLTYDPTDTIDSISIQLKNNAYQVLATNFLLYHNFLTSSNGTNVRKSVDAVLTIIFSEDDININKSWTFYNVSEYPVYVAISSMLINNTINITQTLTVSTPDFTISKSELNYELKDREYYLLP